MIYIFFGIININLKTPNRFLYYKIGYFKKKYHIRLFSKAKMFL